MWGRQMFLAVTTEVVIAEVIRQYENDVWGIRLYLLLSLHVRYQQQEED